MSHTYFLAEALKLAHTRLGFCSPNPSVGAVLVHQDQIIATGSHFASGYPHAEVSLLNSLKKIPTNSCLYVTLEPCCHYGKTPPCTERIIQSGIRTVYFGLYDPNPIVSGKGQSLLREAGITCEKVEFNPIEDFYRSYIHWHQTKKPWITIKIAISFNGKIAGPQNTPLVITGPDLQSMTHQFRKHSDAILTTAKTIFFDNPQLNVREADKIIPKPLYILDATLSLSTNARVFQTAKTITVFHGKEASIENKNLLKEKGVRCVLVRTDTNGLINLHEVIEHIGKDGIHDLWVEAGGKCFNSFIEHNLAHRAYIYIAPKVIANGTDAFVNSQNYNDCRITYRQVGKDVLCQIDF